MTLEVAMKLGSYAKSIVAVVLAVAYAVQAAISDGMVSNDEWVGIALAFLTALGVWYTPNSQPPDSDG